MRSEPIQHFLCPEMIDVCSLCLSMLTRQSHPSEAYHFETLLYEWNNEALSG
jgi:hypothetical protein